MSSTKSQSRQHHYVPQWYQRRFFATGQTSYNYLDLRPEEHRRALLPWSPKRCFYKDDLYTVKLGNWTSDEIERNFFGRVDDIGRRAVETLSGYDSPSKAIGDAYNDLLQYMGAQHLRTPRGLDWIASQVNVKDRNQTLIVMQRIFQRYVTMWAEGVWEIVRASKSATKFIVTDEPVTFYNRRIFPCEISYPGAEQLPFVGTRTLFPLGLESCLVITHLQLVRNPWSKPKDVRVNARFSQPALMYLLTTQFGRELDADEVVRLNLILKRCATRYIAAAEKEWLYPEQKLRWSEWAKLDDDWFLLPNPWKVNFTTGIVVGYKDGSSWVSDEYGRTPSQPAFEDRNRRDKERKTFEEARREWARKRVGKSVAHIAKVGREDEVSDSLMEDFLRAEGLVVAD